MSIMRTALFGAAAIMLLPLEEQPLSGSASSAPGKPQASFCDRNPSTCAASRELAAEFMRKSEIAFSHASQLLKDHMKTSASSGQLDGRTSLLGATSNPGPRAEPVVPPLRRDTLLPERRTTYSMDYPTRLR